MAVNDIIKEADYNSIRNNLVSVMGTGVSNYGWGQNSKIRSSAVAVGDKVSVNDWGNLRYDIINAYVHLYGTTPTTAQVTDSDIIKYRSSFTPDTGTLDAPVTQYNTWVNTISANRFLLGSGQSATTAKVETSAIYNLTAPSPTSWRNSISCVVEVKFNSADEARYFFNSGSTIRFTASKTNVTINAQNTTWTSLLSAAGTVSFGANTPGTGTSPANGLNWYRTTNIDQIWYSTSSSTPYGSNQYRIYSRCNVTNNSNGTASIGYFIVEFRDGYTDPDGGSNIYGPYDAVDGMFTVSVDCVYPSGILVPSGTGNFSVTLPTVTITSPLSGS